MLYIMETYGICGRYITDFKTLYNEEDCEMVTNDVKENLSKTNSVINPWSDTDFLFFIIFDEL